MVHEMVLEHQDVGNSRQFVQLQGNLYAGKIYVQEIESQLGVEELWVNCSHVASTTHST